MAYIKAKKPGTCTDCGTSFDTGAQIRWFPKIGTLCLVPCSREKKASTDASTGAHARSGTKKSSKAAQIPPAVKDESVAETAKRIRQALKISFAGVRFSVRSDSYSGGSSVRVSWTDGPTQKRVQDVIGRYQSVHRCEITGEILNGGNRYVTCNRDSSPELAARAKAEADRLGPDYIWGDRYWRILSDMEGDSV